MRAFGALVVAAFVTFGVISCSSSEETSLFGPADGPGINVGGSSSGADAQDSSAGTGGVTGGGNGGTGSNPSKGGMGGDPGSGGVGGNPGGGGVGGAGGNPGGGGISGVGGNPGGGGISGVGGDPGSGGIGGVGGDPGSGGASTGGDPGSGGIIPPVPVCGNGQIEAPEICDDSFQDDCGTCNATCSGAGTGAICGDGQKCPEREACDDGYHDDCGTCNANCTAAGIGAVCGDGHPCPETEACDDGKTDNCGPCDATCSGDGTGPCGAHCSDGSDDQLFGEGMVGCAGTVRRDERGSLCGPGSVVCTSNRWVESNGDVEPSYHYWVDDLLLYYSGDDGDCAASASQGSTCNSQESPMRACNGSDFNFLRQGYEDPLGNLCNWHGCGLNSADNEYFGGCNGNFTAGSLCCTP